MDLQSFIQSGLLEAYLLGQCSPEERAQVERMAAEHAEVRAEMSSIEASLEGYAATHAVQPPDWMKASILKRIEEEEKNPMPQTPAPSKLPLLFFQLLAFALAAASGFLFLRQKDVGRENEQLRLKVNTLEQHLTACNENAQKPDSITELLCHPATQRILISDNKGIKGINTIVYYNPLLKRMAYDPSGLPALGPDKYYQFWAIIGDKPVSLGMQARGICESLRTVENVQVFAISEEGNPQGNAVPTVVLAGQKTG
ncbi:MAG: anti-sigma factor domain-containing protein [Saprospiraceae bacterium]